jgi:hypothetical protein
MPDPFDFFTISTQRRYFHYALFIGKWLMRLLSASVETFMHYNFGRRYVHMLPCAFLFCLFCSNLAPFPHLSTYIFLLSFFALVIYHYIQVFLRQWRSASEPHSSSTGDSWQIWQRLGLAQTTIHCYVEPVFCWIVGLYAATMDPFLGLWLKTAAVALFLKEQIKRFKFVRRVIDSIDAKLEAQTLNASLKQQQPAPGQGAQKSHRARFPRSGQQQYP